VKELVEDQTAKGGNMPSGQATPPSSDTDARPADVRPVNAPPAESAAAGWDELRVGLSAAGYREPREVEKLVLPAHGDVMLCLYTREPLRVERREGPARRDGADMPHGDVCLSWGGAPSEARAAPPSRVLVLRLSRGLVAHVAAEALGEEPAQVESAQADLTQQRVAGSSDPLLAELARALWSELEGPGPAGELYALHCVRRYACAPAAPTARLPAALPAILPPRAAAGLGERRLAQTLEYIRAHLGEGAELTLEAVARQVGYSPYHFARLFRRATGESLHHLVLRERIARARRLLAETELPLARVATECGFAHQSHLSRVFRQELGHTPRAERLGAGW
jgi:AraC family transcriptional regulator